MTTEDPWLVYKIVKPLGKYKYDLNNILDIIYPLKGKWKWETIRETGDEDIKDLFKRIHMSQTPVVLGKGGHLIPEWHVDAEYNDVLYKKLYVFFNGEDDLSTESEIELSSTSSEPIMLGDKTSMKPGVPEEEPFIRDKGWMEDNPLYNPRFEDDIESGFLAPLPANCTKEDFLKIIEGVKNATDEKFVCADGSGDILTKKDSSCILSFGLYGKKGSLKCARIVAFLKTIQKDYSLSSLDISKFVKKIQDRKSIWKWINVGAGFFRDFEWRLVGNRDMITKTVRCLRNLDGMQPLAPRGSPCKKPKYSFEVDKLWSCEEDECLDIDTDEVVKREDWVDAYGWTSKKYRSEKLDVRQYIFSMFVKKWTCKWIPGKSTKWCETFFELVDGRGYIDFEDPHELIKYSVSTSAVYDFSKRGFAKRKDLLQWNIREIEFYYDKWKTK
uniref:Uncharacterized protein n=1 Tax=viral metagenome TaxID=1070528 RepID=A0A6C0JW43_9ZZZZ